MGFTIRYSGFIKDDAFISMECDSNDVRRKLVIYHKLSGESFADIAKRIGTTRQTIHNWYTGHTKIPYEHVFNMYLDTLLEPYITI